MALRASTSQGQNASGGTATYTGLVKGAQIWQTSRNAFTAFALNAPTGTTSATKVMMGLGATWALTPSFSGRVRILVTGSVTNTLTTNQITWNFNYGTGAAPSNGAALTGTALWASDYFTQTGVANSQQPFSFYAEVTGLTLSTAYWFDMTLAAAANTSAARIYSVLIEEF